MNRPQAISHSGTDAHLKNHPAGVSGNDIGWAVSTMQRGERVCRRGWNGNRMWIALVPEDRTQPLRRLAYVEMFTVDGTIVPWLCSQSDLLAMDWEPAV